MEPTSGKIGENIYFSRLCYIHGYFISSARWKYSLFLQFFPWRTLWLRHFIGYSLRTSRKKASTIFYDTAFQYVTETKQPYNDRAKFLLKTWMPPHHGNVDSAGEALRWCRHPCQPFCFPYIDVCFRENRKIR